MASDGILLEAGTNEMELMVFRLHDTRFGINVAKVREIMQRPKIIPIPHSPDIVEGTFRLRDEVLTMVNVGKFFNMLGEQVEAGEGLVIIVEFNKLRCGILVDAVERIYRVSWDQIQPPPPYLANMSVPITGVADLDGSIVQIADFESIVGSVLTSGEQQQTETEAVAEDDVKSLRLLMADDSATVRRMIEKVMTEAGFENLTIAGDGQEAWEAIEARRKQDPQGLPFDMVLTDIEMPRMDGLHLCSRIKKDPELKAMPVVIFSSLVSSDNENKGTSVGADAQVTKFEKNTLLEAIHKVLGRLPAGA